MTVRSLLSRLDALALSEEDKTSVAARAADLTYVLAYQITHPEEDVQAELDQLKAQADNLTAGVAARFAVKFERWASDLAVALVTKAIL